MYKPYTHMVTTSARKEKTHVWRFLIALCIIAAVSCSPCLALERHDIEFKVFQFPPNMIPKIDGDTSDWEMVTGCYIIGSEQLTDNKQQGKIKEKMDPEDLKVNVRVG